MKCPVSVFTASFLKSILSDISIATVAFLKDYIYLFIDRREGREKERERNINVWLLLMWPPLGTWSAT